MEMDRTPVESWWQDVAEYVVPRKSFITEDSWIDDSRFQHLHDTTAIDACQTLANGHSSFISPADQRWFTFSAPDHVRTDEHEEWYRTCSLILATEMAACNAYTVFDETYLDRSAFGLGSYSVWPGKRNALNYRVHPINSYTLEENDEGYVDEMGFTMELGILQISQMFGVEVLSKSPKLADAYKAFTMSGKNTKHVICHHVWPRRDDERTPGSMEGKDLPYGSIYICKEGETIISESGFTEFPYTCSRYLKHAGRGNQYGFSPSWRAMPSIKSANFLQKVMDLVAEKKAVPSVLVPDYLEGDVDLRAGGITMFAASRVKGSYGLPQEWGNQGSYDVGKDRIEQKHEDINRAYHVDLFRMFAEMERAAQMTAREVAERSSEKLIQFSPSFTRYSADSQTGMRRAFSILLRTGAFPPPPQGLIYMDEKTGRPNVPDPKVLYQSKIALAIQQLSNAGIDKMLERAMAMAQAGVPDAFDNINPDQVVRIQARNDGVPEEVLRNPKEVAMIREQRAEAQRQQMELEQAEMASKAAGNVGIKADQAPAQ